MLNRHALQLRVGVDVGSQCHSVAVDLADGRLLEEFEIPHTAAGFEDFFARIEGRAKRHRYPIAVAMEGYNGHVRPLDSLVRARGWRLFNVNNLKLARFKEIFPAAAKSDRIERAKTLELFQLRDHLPMAGDVLQEVMATPEENDIFIRHAFPWLRHVFADGGYAGPKLGGKLAKIGDWTMEIVKRSDTAKGFEIIPGRWVVERTFAWLNRCRRLAKDWEKTIASAGAWVTIAHIGRVTRRLAR